MDCYNMTVCVNLWQITLTAAQGDDPVTIILSCHCHCSYFYYLKWLRRSFQQTCLSSGDKSSFSPAGEGPGVSIVFPAHPVIIYCLKKHVAAPNKKPQPVLWIPWAPLRPTAAWRLSRFDMRSKINSVIHRRHTAIRGGCVNKSSFHCSVYALQETNKHKQFDCRWLRLVKHGRTLHNKSEGWKRP